MKLDRARSAWRSTAAAAPVALALLLVVGFTAGCGSGSPAGSSADPAGVVPASAPVYAQAVVRPGGDLQSNALAAGRKLTHRSAPYSELVELLQAPGSPALDYEKDVAPWLGPNAAIFFTSLASSSSLESLLGSTFGGSAAASGSGAWPFASGSGSGAQGAIVLNTSDLDKAKAFVSEAASHAGAHGASYRGVSYELSPGGDAFAIVDRLVVLGTESGVRSVIETSQGGSALAHDPTYVNLASVAPAETLAHVYGNPSALAHEDGVAVGSHGLTGLLRALGGGGPVNLSLVPSSSSFALDADVAPATGAAAGGGAGGGGLIGAAASGGSAFGALPGDSWLAAGLGKLGSTAKERELEQLEQVLSLASGLGGKAASEAAASPQVTLSVKGIIEGLLGPLRKLTANSAEASRDFSSWMGEAGIFASGTTILELKAAIVIDSNDPAASEAAVGKLASALRATGEGASPTTLAGTDAAVEAKISGLPVTLVIANGRDASGKTKFVIGLSSTSVQEALDPSSTMSGSPTLTATRNAVGEGATPTVAVNVGSLLTLLEGVGLSEDPSVAPFLPYVRAATTLSGGGKSLAGGIERLRLVLDLQPSEH
jgi:Protein of unknown function (DUF3352)